MKKFTISDLETLSGIKAPTLRAWEQRYGLMQPQRTDANFRYYSIDEVKRLLDLVLLNRNGYRISRLATMSNEEIAARIAQLKNSEDRKLLALNELIVYTYTYHTDAFERTLDRCVEDWPLEEVMDGVVFAFMSKLGILWSGNRLSEEHFVVPIIRRKLIAGIDRIAPAMLHDREVLLFLPEGRQLDLMLLYTNFLLKQQGVRVCYMGDDVSVNNLSEVFRVRQPHFVFTYLHDRNRFRIDELMQIMQRQLPGGRLVIATESGRGLDVNAHAQLHEMDYESAIGLLTEHLSSSSK